MSQPASQTPLAWPVVVDLPTTRRLHKRALVAFDAAMQKNLPEAMQMAWKAAAIAGEQEYRAWEATPSWN